MVRQGSIPWTNKSAQDILAGLFISPPIWLCSELDFALCTMESNSFRFQGSAYDTIPHGRPQECTFNENYETFPDGSHFIFAASSAFPQCGFLVWWILLVRQSVEPYKMFIAYKEDLAHETAKHRPGGYKRNRAKTFYLRSVYQWRLLKTCPV